MGWTFHYSKPRDERAEILSLLTWQDTASFTAEVLKLQKVGSIWFGAIKFTPKPGQTLDYYYDYLPEPDGSHTWMVVILTKVYNGEWGYKDMTEAMGPSSCYARCPNSILKLLSEVKPDSYAARFREDCRRWNNRPKPKLGETWRTPKPLEFGFGNYQEFTKVDWPGYRSVYRTETGSHVRLSGTDLLGAELVQ